MHPRILVANFKSHKTTDDVLSWLETVGEKLQLESSIESIIVCPQFPALAPARKLIDERQWEGLFTLGAQNVSYFDSGPYTGEVSADALQGLVDYVIVGHSERRRLFGEKTEHIGQKAARAHGAGMTPIYCVAEESVEELNQIKGKGYVIAYEPPAAIGSGNMPTKETINNFMTAAEQKIGHGQTLLYGGSVNAETVASLSLVHHLDGLLVGTACLDETAFLNLFYAIRKLGKTTNHV